MKSETENSNPKNIHAFNLQICNLPLNNFVPFWTFTAVMIGVRLVDTVADTNPSVGVHSCHAIVFGKLGLDYCDAQTADRICGVGLRGQELLV